MPTSETRATILRDLCEYIDGAGDVDVVRVTDSTGADATEVIDSSLVDVDGDTNFLGRPWIRIDAKVGAGPSAGEIRKLTKAGLTIATGVLTTAAFTGTPQSATNFSIWRHIHPDTVVRILNSVLRELRRQSYAPVTMLDSRLGTDGDGDMEVSGVASWTADGDETLAKSTTAPLVRHGSQSLNVSASSAAEGVQSQSVPAVEGQQWLVGAALKVTTGACSIQPYDVTGSANIGTKRTSNDLAWQWAEPDWFVVPADCEQIAVRFEGTGAPDDWNVDDVVLWPTLQKEYELPSWVEDPSDLIAIGHYGRGQQYTTQGIYTDNEFEFTPWGWQRSPSIIEEEGAHPFRILLDTPVAYPLYMLAWRPCTELSADTDSTTVRRELIVHLTAQRIFHFLARQAIQNNSDEVASWLTQAQLAGRAAQGYLSGYRWGQKKRRVRAPEFASFPGADAHESPTFRSQRK